MTFRPTEQQAFAAEAVNSGKRVRIAAYAGTGKTSSLVYIAGTSRRSSTYLAFNKSIAMDAKAKFPRHVDCLTTHAMAFRAMRPVFKSYPDKMTSGFNGGLAARELGLKSLHVGPAIALSPRAHGALVVETVRRYMRSGAEKMGAWCVPMEGALANLPEALVNSFQVGILGKAWTLWSRMVDPMNPFPLGHDGYLKLWALGRPTIPGEVIFLDEAQDTNGVVLELIRQQQAQIVCVGDRHQQLYDWRGAKDAMTELPCDIEARLSKSWRFGLEAAANASRYLALLGETVPLEGNGARTTAIVDFIEKPNTVLARTNARIIEVLIGALTRNERPYVVGGVADILVMLDAAEQLQANRPVDRPLEFVGFESWASVEEASEQPGGEDLKRWVNLVNTYGVAQLRDALNKLPRNERDASILLSTGHKAKGREWDRVRLEDDFLRGIKSPGEGGKNGPPVDDPAANNAELRLLYVAATRGMAETEIPTKLQEKVATLEETRSKKARAA